MGSLTASRFHLFKYAVKEWYKTLVFWDRHQGLYFGLALLSACLARKGFYLALFIGMTQPNLIRMVGFYLLFALMLLRLEYVENPPFPKGRLMGKGYLQISKIYRLKGKREDVINVHGNLAMFQINGKAYRDLPCYLSFPKNSDVPKADCDYYVSGRLQPKPHSNILYVSSISPVAGTHNFAQMRFNWKEAVRTHIKAWVDREESAELFCTLATGDIEDTEMRNMFREAGLSHTLAISGFHYTWLAIVVTFFLQLFFSRYTTSYIMIVLAAFYFFMMGASPSLSRAWLAITISFIAYIAGYRNTPVNALGLAIFVALLINPYAAYHLGFQFSFGATFAILTWSDVMLSLVRKIWPKRTLDDVKRMRFWEQIVLILAGYFKRAIALILCVNMFIVPLTLVVFEEYSIWGLWYNLIFPAMLTVSMILLLVGLLLWGSLGGVLLKVAGWYTAPLMWWVYYGRSSFEGVIHGRPWGWLVEVWLVGLVVVGFWLEDRQYRLTVIARSV